MPTNQLSRLRRRFLSHAHGQGQRKEGGQQGSCMKSRQDGGHVELTQSQKANGFWSSSQKLATLPTEAELKVKVAVGLHKFAQNVFSLLFQHKIITWQN